MISLPLRRAVVLLISLTTLNACTPLNKLMKAKPATPDAGFLDFRATPDNQTARSPWHYAGFTIPAGIALLSAGLIWLRHR